MKKLNYKHSVILLFIAILFIGVGCSSKDELRIDEEEQEDTLKGDTEEEIEDETFKLLENASDIVIIEGKYNEKYRAEASENRVFDARTASFNTDNIKWGTIDIKSSASITGMVWAGGYVYSTKPWNSTWNNHKATDEPDLPGRNSTAIENRAYSTTITGMYVHNVHDAFRSEFADNWRVQHSWSSYVRDDAIENDRHKAGSVYDCLFDGTYTGFSNRPDDKSLYANGNVITVDKVLMRMQAMPYPYKWTEKAGIINENNEPYTGDGVPYGHGPMFKINNDDNSKNMHWSIKNSVFVGANNVDARHFNFPDASIIDECSNVTIVWLGSGDYPGYLPTEKFPNAFTILTGQEGRDFWIEKVTDWHKRHPNVGADHKPTLPGEIIFPEKF